MSSPRRHEPFNPALGHSTIVTGLPWRYAGTIFLLAITLPIWYPFKWVANEFFGE